MRNKQQHLQWKLVAWFVWFLFWLSQHLFLFFHICWQVGSDHLTQFLSSTHMLQLCRGTLDIVTVSLFVFLSHLTNRYYCETNRFCLSNIAIITNYHSDVKISPQLFSVLQSRHLAAPSPSGFEIWFHPMSEKKGPGQQAKHHLLYHQFSQVSLVLVVLHASLRYLFHRLLFKRSLQVMVCFAFDFFIFPTRFLSTHIASCISTFPTTIYMIKFCERQFAGTSLNFKRSAIFFSLVYCTNFVRQSTNTP